jgi:hypothetical protein
VCNGLQKNRQEVYQHQTIKKKNPNKTHIKTFLDVAIYNKPQKDHPKCMYIGHQIQGTSSIQSIASEGSGIFLEFDYD